MRSGGEFTTKLEELKRVLFDVVVAGVLMVILYFHIQFDLFPQAFSFIIFKAILVSLAVVHAHITRKLFFGSANWDDDSKGGVYKKVLIIAIYVMFIYAYSIGGV